jgi:dynein heavy chain
MQMVAPKRAALAEANRKLEGANKKLAGIRSRVKELQDRVTALEEGLMKATADKNAAIAQVGICNESRFRRAVWLPWRRG